MRMSGIVYRAMKSDEEKKMRKVRVLTTILIAMLIAVTMIGCGSTASIDINALAGDLNSKIQYEDSLETLDADIASNFINLSGFTYNAGAFFEGSGATAEEIVVLECATKDDATRAGEALNQRVSEQIESFTDYVPAELEKLNRAVVVVKGNYAILSVSNDPDGARQIIDGYLK